MDETETDVLERIGLNTIDIHGMSPVFVRGDQRLGPPNVITVKDITWKYWMLEQIGSKITTRPEGPASMDRPVVAYQQRQSVDELDG